MTNWEESELVAVGAAEELELRSQRADGSLRAAVTMWVVRSGRHLYVRSVKGTAGPWYRGTQARHQGSVAAGGVLRDVAFREADPDEYQQVDAAYRTKYGRYPAIVEHVLTDQARASTLRLEPR
ncbi:DUF2255 family protein [Streptomyces sp. NPDC002742]|uniref:DUF2255 family protein n=1 Tax=Streptomyces sp. NPDC002742 TaxID=3364663 RepID=UPI00369717AD